MNIQITLAPLDDQTKPNLGDWFIAQIYPELVDEIIPQEVMDELYAPF